MKYRPHKGKLADSVAGMVEIEATKYALVTYLRKELAPWPTLDGFHFDAVHVDPYFAGDPRIGWDDVWIVTLDGYGVLGFTDGPAL